MRFIQPGSYPGIPGTFANCDVEVDGDGNVIITPLVQAPAFEGAPTIPETSPHETVVSEQATPSAPQFIGG